MLLCEEVEILTSVPLFADLPATRLRQLAWSADRLHFAPGQVLYREGEDGSSAFVVLAGEAEVASALPGGGVNRRHAGPASVLGERAILGDGLPRGATATAAGPLEALRITRDAFQRLMAGCPESTAAVLHSLGDRVAADRAH